MEQNKDQKTRYDPSKQIELLINQCHTISPVIYKYEALYLQIIRKKLPESIKQAVFTLITESDYNFLNSSSSKSRIEFQINLETLINRSELLNNKYLLIQKGKKHYIIICFK